MVRDFFAFLISKADTSIFHPGTYELSWLGDAWKTKAESAYARALKAVAFEKADGEIDAGWEWQKIFGTYIPLYT
jgi:hypothetical protein